MKINILRENSLMPMIQIVYQVGVLAQIILIQSSLRTKIEDIFVLNVNPIHRNDVRYFKNLKDLCFNQECGDIFYSYLLQINANEIDVADPPETDLHERMIMLSNPSWISFIKFSNIRTK